ncbi:MAG: Ig-like domain-containing protein [Patescibacteria group bacterium]
MVKKLPFLLLLAIVLIGFSVAFGLYEVKFFNTRASVTITTFSPENSYVFVTPLAARANGQEKIRLTVFILNNQGLGVLGKNVFVSPDSALNIEAIQGLTDGYGKAYFDISASKAGEYYLEVKVDDTALKQKAHLSFN